MAANNLFQVTNLVLKGELVDYVAQLKTAMMARPYKKFDMNATQGATINELFPYKWNVNDGLTFDPATQVNNTIDKEQPITLGATLLSTGTKLSANSPFSLSGYDMSFFSHATTVDEFRSYYQQTNGMQIADNLNQKTIEACYEYWCDVEGSPTADFNGFASLQEINSMISSMELMKSGGRGEMCVGLHPDAFYQMQVPYAGYFNQNVNAPMLKTANTNYQAGLNIYDDNLIQRHQNGSFATSGTVQVASTVANGTLNASYQTIALKGFSNSSTGVLLAGDILTFGVAGNYVNRLLPIGKQDSGRRKGFVVLSDDTGNPVVSSDGSGLATIRVRCIPIFRTGAEPNPYANISRQIITNDVVNLFGGANTMWTKNLVFSRAGFFFANPEIATYPLLPNQAGAKLSAFPYEQTEKVIVPNTGGMSLALNIANSGDMGAFSNLWCLRSIIGVLPFENYGFIYASKA